MNLIIRVTSELVQAGTDADIACINIDVLLLKSLKHLFMFMKGICVFCKTNKYKNSANIKNNSWCNTFILLYSSITFVSIY